MSDSLQEDKKSSLYVAGFVMILAGIAVMLIFMSGDVTYNALELLVMVIGVGIVRVSKLRGLSDVIAEGNRGHRK